MSERYPRGFSAAEKTELWDRWQRGEFAESDWTSVWQAVVVYIFPVGTARGNSSCATAPLAVGVDARGTRGDIPRHCGASIGTVDG